MISNIPTSAENPKLLSCLHEAVEFKKENHGNSAGPCIFPWHLESWHIWKTLALDP